MSVAKVGQPNVHSQAAMQRRLPEWDSRSLARAKVGEEVSLRIGQKIYEDRYLATFGSNRYVVVSSMEFTVGQTVKATVSAVGGVVELKYRGSGQFEVVDATAARDQEFSSAVGAIVDKLEGKYKVSMRKDDRLLVETLSEQVSHPESMTAGALYLSKLSTPIEQEALRALYERQVWPDDKAGDLAVAHKAAVNVSALLNGIQKGAREDVDALAKMLGDAVESSAQADVAGGSLELAALAAAAGRADNQQQPDSRQESNDHLEALARRLLRIQDAGAVSYHYGSLPVMIADQLVELDLVYFRERDSAERTAGLRKLVMTLKTETLGRIEIVAQSRDTHLSVSIGTQSAAATEQLAGHAAEVRELVSRLGWNVDSVAYRLASEPRRAAEQLIRHVLETGSLDAVV